jgi:hypothetical protein
MVGVDNWGRDRIFWTKSAALLKVSLDSKELSAAFVISSIRDQMEFDDRAAEEEALRRVG